MVGVYAIERLDSQLTCHKVAVNHQQGEHLPEKKQDIHYNYGSIPSRIPIWSISTQIETKYYT
jgi:hypothetical protein